eukprot:5109256-Pyramimonas_sp.AAC.1
MSSELSRGQPRGRPARMRIHSRHMRSIHPLVGGSHISTWSSDRRTGGRQGNSFGAARQA